MEALWPMDALHQRQQLDELGLRGPRIPRVSNKGSQVSPHLDRVGMLGTQDSLQQRQQLDKLISGRPRIPRLARPRGQIRPRNQRVLVLDAKGTAKCSFPLPPAFLLIAGLI
jgi:hypothetical protein